MAHGAGGFAGHIGASQVDITPPVGIRATNWGPADWKTSEGNHGRLTLTAITLQSDPSSQPLVLIGLDAGFWNRVADELTFRTKILQALGLPSSRVLVALSHTHAGPCLCAADEPLEAGETVPAYLDFLAGAAMQAARNALAEAQPAALEWTVGHCDLARNRDLIHEGRALTGFNPAGTAPDEVLVGRVTATSTGRVIATIVNYACHPTTLAWQNRLISADYVGTTKELAQRYTGAPCLFLQGASGDLAPAEQYTGDTDIAERHGRSLGFAVLSALNTMPDPATKLELTGTVESGAPLAMWQPATVELSSDLEVVQDDVDLDFRELKTLEQLQQDWSDIPAQSREERLRRARNQRENYITGPGTQHPIWVAKIGDAIIAGHPGEAYSALQVDLRASFPDRHIVVVNLVNGPGFVYLPTQAAYEQNAYTAWQTPLQAGSLEKMTAKMTQLITTLTGRRP